MSNIINDVKGVGSTFTSWDSCMSKTYCKWPVIAAIIFGSLIVLSILWCIFSCLCCGISLCTACTKCLTCGGCCGLCGNSGRRRKDPEYQPMPPTPTPYNGGYQPQPAPMMYNHSAPQFATFDAGHKSNSRINEDSLPAMPSWNTAATRRVEDTSPQPQRGSNMEMEHMISPTQMQSPGQQQPEHLQQNYPARGAALSPVHEREASYPGSQNYAQNTSYHGHEMNDGYSNDQYQHVASPRSPAPSYYSTVQPMAPAMHHQQPHNTYDQYNARQNPYSSPTEDRNMTSSVAPYPSSRESTQFAAQRTASPPSATNYNSYDVHRPEQNQGARPPSLLQVGRKPVAGSYREV